MFKIFQIKIKINGKKLKRVENSKYFELIYYVNIKWAIHVDSIIKKSKYLVYVFYRLKPVLTKKQLLQIYYLWSISQCFFLWNNIGWGGLYNNTFDPLDRLQKRILKIIGILDNDPNRPLDKKLVFIMKVILFQYEELKNKYELNPINTRYKSLKLVCHLLTISQRCYIYSKTPLYAVLGIRGFAITRFQY